MATKHALFAVILKEKKITNVLSLVSIPGKEEGHIANS